MRSKLMAVVAMVMLSSFSAAQDFLLSDGQGTTVREEAGPPLSVHIDLTTETLAALSVTTPTLQQVLDQGSTATGSLSLSGTVTAGGAVLTTGTVANAPVSATDIVNKEYADGLSPDITTPTLQQVLDQGSTATGSLSVSGTVTAGGAALSTGTITHTPANASDITNVLYVEQQFEQGFVRVIEAGGELPPIHHYTLNETWESTVVPDWGTGGRNLTSTVNASVWSTDGLIQGGFQVLDERTAAAVGTGVLYEYMTLSVWLRVPDINAFNALGASMANHVFGYSRGSNIEPMICIARSGSNLIIGGAESAANGGAFTVSGDDRFTWHHVVAVYRPKGGAGAADRPWRLYVDGILRANGTSTFDQTTSNFILRLGRLLGSAGQQVIVDDARIYNYQIDVIDGEINDAMVQRLYNADPATGVAYGTEATITSGANVARRSTIVGSSGDSWTSFAYPGHEDEFRTVIDGSPVLTATSYTVTAYRDLHTTGTLYAQDIVTTATIEGTTVTAGAFVDRTPGWARTSQEALDAILGLGYETHDGVVTIDHSTLPPEARGIAGYEQRPTGRLIEERANRWVIEEREADVWSEERKTTETAKVDQWVQREIVTQREETEPVPVIGRDLGALITIQSEAIKALEARIRALETKPAPGGEVRQ